MNNKSRFITKLFSLVYVICLLTIFILPVVAQQANADSKQDKLLPPAEEKFAVADAIASPWRVGECPDDFYKISDCHKVSGKYELRHTSIYNNDGSLWYVYSNQSSEPDYYRRNKTMDFLPFAGVGDYGRDAILRMVGESDHWYKVEVNENTQTTKFILKSDSRWEKTTWDFWLARIAYFAVDENGKTQTYDKPNGNIIGQSLDSKIKLLRYLGKRDGDWAYFQVQITGQFCYPVESKSEQCYPGWIRWRKDRDFLVKPDNILFKLTEGTKLALEN